MYQLDINILVMGQRIRSARRMRNMTAEVLAEAIGITSESLGHIECGARKPSLQTLYNLALTLDVSMDYLVGRTLSPSETVVHSSLTESNLTAEQEKLLMDLVRSIIPVIKK
jgi:transcriptional regulator with XRE-family HTH domain